MTPSIATGISVMTAVAQSWDLMMNTQSMSLICGGRRNHSQHAGLT
jgi:hypothetical protein